MYIITRVCILLALCLNLATYTVSENGQSLVIVILSQPDSFHAHMAGMLKEGILKQAEGLNMTMPDVVLLHEWTDNVGAWTILPILSRLLKEHSRENSAYIFCEENVILHLHRLVSHLRSYNMSEELFLGRAMHDKEATIIHHFAFHENPKSFAYPDFSACFVMSSTLVKSVVERLKKSPPYSEFSIDAQHELAMYVYDNGRGTSLSNVDFLCGYTNTEQRSNCATYSERKLPTCSAPVDNDKVLFAVKTCKKYHKDRVPVLKRTWGGHAKHIQYFSDVDDPSIPTITLNVPNTERGHCAKCFAILRYIYDRLNTTDYDWIVIVDDDTLMSVSRLRKLLSCYYSTDLVALGERYGYAVARDGYNYITLGGGMVLSKVLLKQLVEDEDCKCSANDSPDDMTLGMCLKQLKIPITHSSLFHQGRPDDYAVEYLSNQLPVSFHRHWMIDAQAVYKTWLSNDDDDSVNSDIDDEDDIDYKQNIGNKAEHGEL